MDHRSKNGPFANVDQLDDVPGIGPATLANIRHMVVIDGDAVASSTPSTSVAPTASSSGANSINVNSASQGDLETLPGIGPSKASAIIQYRTENGPFASCDALTQVNGIGSATLASIRDRCSVD